MINDDNASGVKNVTTPLPLREGGGGGSLVDEKMLDALAESRERDRVGLTLCACLDRVQSRTFDINALLYQKKRRTEILEDLKHLAAAEIEAVVEGKMIVKEFHYRSGPEQVKFIYTGKHWECVAHQQFLDFAKAACKKMGFGNMYYEDEKFMNMVFGNVGFRISQYINTADPHDGVWINMRNGTLEIRPRPLTRPTGTLSPKGEGEVSNADGGDSAKGSQREKVTSSSPFGERMSAGQERGHCQIVFREHRPSDFFHYCLNYDYDPEAKCPKWKKFLNEVLDDEDTQSLLGEFIGYCFTRNLKLEKMALFYGGGANGKSVTLDVITRLMGKANVSEAMLNSVTSDPEARAQIEGKLVNISSESNAYMNNAILKKLISGEATEVRILYEGTRLMRDIPKFITSFNTMPSLEQTQGMRRRMIIFPFDHTIPVEKQDFMLSQKLYMELPGIMNWVLEKLEGLLQKVARQNGEGFTISRKCNTAFADYVKNSNSAYAFLSECCEKSDESTLPMRTLYQEYCDYARECGFTKVLIKKDFKKIVHETGIEAVNHSNIIMYKVKVIKGEE